MEYRRRRRVSRKKPQGRGGGRVLLLILILLGAVYFVSVSAAGSWLSEHVVEPVAAMFTQKNDEKENSLSDEAVQTSVSAKGRIEIPAMECYLLQAGVFSDEENARSAADKLTAEGGGGYVHFDGERYRVFVSGYSTEAEARQAKQELAEKGLDCSVHEMHSAGTYDVAVTAGTDNTVNELQEALFSLLSAHDDLLELEKSFDGTGMTPKEAAKAVSEIYSQLEKGTKHTDGLPSSVAGMISDIKAKVKELSESGDADTDTFSAKLKYVQIMIACRFTQTISELIGA